MKRQPGVSGQTQIGGAGAARGSKGEGSLRAPRPAHGTNKNSARAPLLISLSRSRTGTAGGDGGAEGLHGVVKGGLAGRGVVTRRGNKGVFTRGLAPSPPLSSFFSSRGGLAPPLQNPRSHAHAAGYRPDARRLRPVRRGEKMGQRDQQNSKTRHACRAPASHQPRPSFSISSVPPPQVIAPTADGTPYLPGTHDATLALPAEKSANPLSNVPRLYVMSLPARPSLTFDRITFHARVSQCLASLDAAWAPWYLAVAAPTGDVKVKERKRGLRFSLILSIRPSILISLSFSLYSPP